MGKSKEQLSYERYYRKIIKSKELPNHKELHPLMELLMLRKIDRHLKSGLITIKEEELCEMRHAQFVLKDLDEFLPSPIIISLLFIPFGLLSFIACDLINILVPWEYTRRPIFLLGAGLLGLFYLFILTKIVIKMSITLAKKHENLVLSLFQDYDESNFK